MSLERVEGPEERLKDLEYAKEFGAEVAKASLAVCLATARLEAHLTQRELAEKIGKSQPYVSKLESGEANPTLASIGRMLACLGRKLACDSEPILEHGAVREGGWWVLRTPAHDTDELAGLFERWQFNAQSLANYCPTGPYGALPSDADTAFSSTDMALRNARDVRSASQGGVTV